MLDTTYLLISVLTITILAAIVMVRPQRDRQVRGAIAIVTMALLMFLNAQPAQAAMAAQDSATNPTEEEALKTDPGGRHYSGIEYVDSEKPDGTAYNDDKIEREIKSINDRLTAGVVNGSVIVSGRVADKATAKDVVAKVKAIPGVHEVTFDLGLEQGDF
ncbi:MAG: hypothetical protein SAJ12_08850 [Jaaginema sp. PMC 1079.18]|nr:hypothetical protein [Jaaginema sp. PMC 1080.18]MEC4851108.1 hypothetical protein [Jaaginema sp. PMC 1079.18]MEC4867378.1 hypothetical protein [Jaaginema sp. PMC 1078.18]